MQTLLRPLVAPAAYWRTLLLVPSVGLLVDTVFQDRLAVLLSTLACAFIFRGYERRRWIHAPAEFLSGDVILRLGLVFVVTSVAQLTGA
ncbi:hypothetical protein HNQ60_004932 [Povalibacter uvarum]|uniref:Uncharacterized protein n=1 Tax=Povalibacter uvarum TaxID=732238 RepID=A0A841HRR1_9GAMM|nr:hypothetical protein [Povalibacter uvarum]MBB6096041.1 hypothetical protein [Povalibacter uvarum]